VGRSGMRAGAEVGEEEEEGEDLRCLSFDLRREREAAAVASGGNGRSKPTRTLQEFPSSSNPGDSTPFSQSPAPVGTFLMDLDLCTKRVSLSSWLSLR